MSISALSRRTPRFCGPSSMADSDMEAVNIFRERKHIFQEVARKTALKKR